MNRNTLFIAIAVIAVVVIAVAVLLAGQSGPLAGRLGQIPTSLNLSVSACSAPDYRGYVSYTVTGQLLDADGGPVANRTVDLVTMGCTADGACYSDDDSLVTRADGAFSIRKHVPPDGNVTADRREHYRASFAGDEQYGPSSSADVYKPC